MEQNSISLLSYTNELQSCNKLDAKSFPLPFPLLLADISILMPLQARLGNFCITKITIYLRHSCSTETLMSCKSTFIFAQNKLLSTHTTLPNFFLNQTNSCFTTIFLDSVGDETCEFICDGIGWGTTYSPDMGRYASRRMIYGKGYTRDTEVVDVSPPKQ